MTNNLDQFDQSPDFDQESADGEKKAGIGTNLSNAWRTKPIFKLVVLLASVAAVIMLVINFTTSPPETERSRVANPPGMTEAPGGKASPAFIEAQAEANKQRIQEAAAVGGTALPTPLPTGMNTDTRREGDPLVEFRAEMQKQKDEQARQIQALQQQTQRQQSATIQQDQQVQQQLGQNYQQQMAQLAQLWKPVGMNIIGGLEQDYKKSTATNNQGVNNQNYSSNSVQTSSGGQNMPGSGPGAESGQPQVSVSDKGAKPLILAGTVNYGQLLTEANSDVPGPILAQIVSGPLSGARAIGSFQVGYDLMTLTFNTATLKGKEYRIKALALDPDTTLGGMATEVDHRYFARVLLPAAASFVAAFGQELGKKPTTVVVAGNGQVISSQARSGIKDGMYAGLGSAGQTIANFLQQEGAQTKVLVRIAVGTPMGLFFTESVCSGKYPCTSNELPANRSNAAMPVAARQPADQALSSSAQ